MKLRSLEKNNNGALAYFIVFILIVFTLITLFAIASPMLINFNVEFFGAGEDILDSAEDSIDSISDSEMKTQIQDSLGDAQESTANQISILASFYQYAWIFIIIVVTFVIFMIARSNVEVSSGIR